MSEGRYGYVIEVVDRFGKPLAALSRWADAAKSKMDGLNSTLQKPSPAPIATTARSIAQLKTNIDRYRKAAEESFRPDHIKRYNSLIAETEKRIRSLQGTAEKKSTEGVLEKLGGFGLSPAMVGGAAAAAVAYKAIQFGGESVDAAAQMEKYQVTLKTMLGTTTAARDRMQEYVDIAKKTPFELSQVVELGNGLQAVGRYSKDNVNMIGDLAAASGKPVEQALGAFSKLATGQKGIAVDMFRDLLVTTDDWTKATGKGVSKSGELLATTEELIAALPQIMKSKGYFGMMANQAETTTGKVSNLKDGVFGLKVAVGERLKPAYDAVVVSASKAVSTMTKWVEIPTVQKIAAEKAELNALVEGLIAHNGEADVRKSIIDQIQQKYPEFLKNINLERASTTELRKELEKTNAAYDKRIRKAAYKQHMDALDEKAQASMSDILAYQHSMSANKEVWRLKNKALGLTGRKYWLSGTGRPMQDESIVDYLRTEAGFAGVAPQKKVELEQVAGELAAQLSLTTVFGNDEARMKKAQKKYDAYKAQQAIIQKIMDSEFGAEQPTPDDPGGGKGGKGKGGVPTATDTLEKASDVISGGGRTVKTFNIRIENVIGENTNVFSSSDDNPDTATSFMQRLSDAIQSIVNDANYAAN